MKRTLLLFVVILVLAAGWSVGWFYVADKVETVIADGRQKLFERGQAADCNDQTLSGFPFRISLTCSSSGYRDAGTGFSIDAGAMRTASQVYQPGKAVVEIDGPAILHMPVGAAFDINWDTLRASVVANLGGPDRFSIVGKGLEFKPRDSRYDALDAEEVQLHGRKMEANDVDFAVTSDRVLSLQDRWPAFSLVANIRIRDAFNYLLRRPDVMKLAREKGLNGHVSELTYRLIEGGEVTLSGPYTIDQYGILDGTFEIRAQKLTKLAAALEKVLPENRKLFRQISQAAGLLGGDDGAGRIRFSVSVSRGNASIGLIPLGRIPPLY